MTHATRTIRKSKPKKRARSRKHDDLAKAAVGLVALGIAASMIKKD